MHCRCDDEVYVTGYSFTPYSHHALLYLPIDYLSKVVPPGVSVSRSRECILPSFSGSNRGLAVEAFKAWWVQLLDTVITVFSDGTESYLEGLK
jgi:hypothetical protein